MDEGKKRRYLASILRHSLQSNYPAAIERVLAAVHRLDDLELKIAWCSCLFRSAYIEAALAYYEAQKQHLLLDPFLTIGRIKAAMRWAQKEHAAAATGVCMVELGLLELYGMDIAEMKDLEETVREVAADKLRHLLFEFVKHRPNVIACPRCGGKQTRYLDYTVVLGSGAMECRKCRHLWKISAI
ncbi:hypothetical protein [Candidatus Nitrososphaera sp. FF02]|uniref:hypothetical protein n=1 Tax=Candidatus Nitrososphaera sp. FF02 TaxID=3398226 RepID=UPI0039ECFD8F